jgi:hypothetical protein
MAAFSIAKKEGHLVYYRFRLWYVCSLLTLLPGSMKPIVISALILFTLALLSASGSDVGTVVDIDGNVYQTVTIGTHVWVAEKLRVTHYRNGEPVPNITGGTAPRDLTTGAHCNFNNDGTNVATYGRLYNWYAVSDTQNIAPAGRPNPVRACAASPGGLYSGSCATGTGIILTYQTMKIILEMLGFLLHT